MAKKRATEAKVETTKPEDAVIPDAELPDSEIPGPVPDAAKEVLSDDDKLVSYIEGDFEEKDAIEYIAIRRITAKNDKWLKAAGKDKLSQRQFSADFHEWVKADKPRPHMIETPPGAVNIPRTFYRSMSEGREVLHGYYTNGKKFGIEEVIIYKEQENPVTGETVVTNEVQRKYNKCTLEYSEKKVREMITDMDQMLPSNKKKNFYCIIDGNVISVSRETFLKPWADIENAIVGSRIGQV